MTDAIPPLAPLPRWRCHKVVQAAKIIGNAKADGVWTHLMLEGPQSIEISPALRKRLALTNDDIGGYYVRYEDGYESWSPAKAFEDGYIQCGPHEPMYRQPIAALWHWFEKAALEEFDLDYPKDERSQRIKRICVTLCVQRGEDPYRMFLYVPYEATTFEKKMIVPWAGGCSWLPAWCAYHEQVQRVVDAEVSNEP